MQKFIYAILLSGLLFLFGCSVTQKEFVYGGASNDLSHAFDAFGPHLYECFGKTEAEAKKEINNYWIQEVATVSAEIEDKADLKKVEELYAKAMARAFMRYIGSANSPLSPYIGECKRFRTAFDELFEDDGLLLRKIAQKKDRSNKHFGL